MIFHVTDLDSMQWYRKVESMSSFELIARLQRTSEPNDKMLMGTAWHSVLEDPPDEIGVVERDGFRFRVECEADIVLPQVREVRAYKNYSVGGCSITLTGKCDGITGNRVYDHKLTFREAPENYFDSYQWRAYLNIFECTCERCEDGVRWSVRAGGWVRCECET